MAKAMSRKHATHKKARAHHAAKPHARRVTRPAAIRVSNPPEIVPDPEMVGEDIVGRFPEDRSEPEQTDLLLRDEESEDQPGEDAS